MAVYKRQPESDGFYGGTLRRCSVCRFYNDIRRSPRLGELVTPSVVESTDSVTGKTFYVHVGNSSGCSLCGSPLWADGGRH